jgi:putative transposase
MLIVGHLDRVLGVYVQHDNRHRPHRALGVAVAKTRAGSASIAEEHPAEVHRRDLLGGLLHEYQRAA